MKSIHLELISTLKEQELLVKACFIQCHLKEVALDEKNQACSTQQVFSLTTLASHLWYQGKEDSSYSFEQSCLTHAADLQTAYQHLFPKVIAAYQDMLPHLPEKQLNALAQQALDIARLSNQSLTKDNLNTLTQSVLGTSLSGTTGTSPNLPSPTNEQEVLKSGQDPSSFSRSLDSRDAKQQESHPSISLKLSPSFENVTTHLIEQYRHQQSQLEINQTRKLHLVHELER